MRQISFDCDAVPGTQRNEAEERCCCCVPSICITFVLGIRVCACVCLTQVLSVRPALVTLGNLSTSWGCVQRIENVRVILSLP